MENPAPKESPNAHEVTMLQELYRLVRADITKRYADWFANAYDFGERPFTSLQTNSGVSDRDEVSLGQVDGQDYFFIARRREYDPEKSEAFRNSLQKAYPEVSFAPGTSRRSNSIEIEVCRDDDVDFESIPGVYLRFVHTFFEDGQDSKEETEVLVPSGRDSEGDIKYISCSLEGVVDGEYPEVDMSIIKTINTLLKRAHETIQE